MGCASSQFLDGNDDYAKIGDPSAVSGGLSHHIVSLTSTTYGILRTLDYPRPQIISSGAGAGDSPEIINSWELMAGLDTSESFRFSPKSTPRSGPLRPLDPNALPNPNPEKAAPPGGEKAVIIYTTTLRGIRKTFEDCNSVRSAITGLGVRLVERDISMHARFREELKELMKGRGEFRVPRVFVKGKYIGGAEEVLRIQEEGGLGKLVEGVPKGKIGAVCEGCGGGRFLPCGLCSGSCKVVVEGRKVVRCVVCNENGLVICPICG